MIRFQFWAYITISVFFIVSANAQNNTISPYSKLGIGEFEQLGYGRNAAMGYTGVALRSSGHVNVINVASLTEIDSTMVMFDMGMHAKRTTLSTGYASGSKNNANLSYLSLGFAVNNKLAMAGGIIPYTSVGYDIEFGNDINGQPKSYYTHMQGSGGLNSMFGAIAYRPLKNTSIGINAQLIFGPKKEMVTYYISAADDFELYEEKLNTYKGLKVDLGIQQVFNISKNQSLVFGATANLPGWLQNSYDYTLIKTYPEINDSRIIESEEDAREDIYMPTNIGVGLAYHIKERLILSADAHYNPYKQMKISDENSEMIDNYIYAFGAEYRPYSFGKRIDLAWRAGSGLETGFYKVNNQTLKRISLTAGAGFRIRSLRFNLYGGYNWKGTFKGKLIKENNYVVGLNISFIDFWFHQRKFN